jgi:hypothetical protein
VRCELQYTVTTQADGSVQVTETTKVTNNGVDDDSLKYFLEPNLDKIAENLLKDCCGIPDTQSGDTPTDGGSTHAMVDASGHPGFWHPGDASVDENFTTTPNGIAPVAGSPGKYTLDPCAIAAFACGQLADGQQLVLLFGDGGKATLTGTPGVQTHVYPTFSTPQKYFGELVLLGPKCSNDESRECNFDQKAHFTLTN